MMLHRQKLAGHARRGYTLVELLVAMTSATLLLAGLGASVLVTTKAFRPETGVNHARANAAFAQHDLLADLKLATGFTERTDKAATFFVPDRDGDGRPETLRYAWSGVSGAPLTLSYNGASEFPVVTDVRGLSLTYLTQAVAGTALPAEQTGSQILLLVNDSSSPTSAEASRKTLLESWNFVVVMLGLNDGYDKVLNAAGEAKAIYVSGSLNSNGFDWATKLAETSTGIVNEHPDFTAAFGFAESASLTSASQVNIATNSHYITASFSTGNSTITSWPTSLAMLKNSPSSNLNSLATVSSTPALATIDSGKSLHDGRTAAGRRVFLPWGGSGFDPKYLNSNGQLLTCKAIEWATGLGDDSPVYRNFGYETVFSTSTTGSDSQLGTKAVLTDKGRVVSITAYVGGDADVIRYAIYSDKNGEPDALLAQSPNAFSATSMGWVTIAIPPTELNAGTYWLSLSLESSNQKLHYSTSVSNAGLRRKDHRPIRDGYANPWGSSNSAGSGARSIYATYEVLK